MPCGLTPERHTQRVPSCLWRRIIIVLILSLLSGHADGSKFFWQKPSQEEVSRFLSLKADLPHNHEHAQTTRLPETNFAHPNVMPGWTSSEYGAVIGEGQKAYKVAVEAMQEWRMMENVEWAGLQPFYGASAQNPMVGTVAKCYGGLLWVLNPCRQSYLDVDLQSESVPPRPISSQPSNGFDPFDFKAGAAPTSCYSQIAYATLRGHLIQGEERFVVSWDGQDEGEVRFGVWSVSRGNGPLGSMLFPLMKPMQQRFFQDQVESMKETLRTAGVGVARRVARQVNSAIAYALATQCPPAVLNLWESATRAFECNAQTPPWKSAEPPCHRDSESRDCSGTNWDQRKIEPYPTRFARVERGLLDDM